MPCDQSEKFAVIISHYYLKFEVSNFKYVQKSVFSSPNLRNITHITLETFGDLNCDICNRNIKKSLCNISYFFFYNHYYCYL